MKQKKDLNKLLEQIAKEHLLIQTLETQHRDGIDFHDVAVWSIKGALEAAYAAGHAASSATTSNGNE